MSDTFLLYYISLQIENSLIPKCFHIKSLYFHRIQNSTHNETDEHIDSADCNGCHKRDAKIKSLLAIIERLKKSQEQKRKLICYWKSLAVFNTKHGRKETIVVKIDQLRQKSKRIPPAKRTKSNEITPEISLGLIKVEGTPIEPMDVERDKTSFEPEPRIIEIADEGKSKKANMSVKKSSEELQNCLLKRKLLIIAFDSKLNFKYKCVFSH